MPVLLLTRGDAPSRELLKRAIDARYGFQPPTLESLHASFKGRAQVTRGIYRGWAPVTLDLDVRFPFQSRAHFTGKLLMVSVATEDFVFDGAQLHRSGGDPVSEKESESAYAQMWALNTLLLTPLNDMGVELHVAGDLAFDAVHKASGLTTRVTLDSSNRVTSVRMNAYNFEADSEQTLELSPSVEQVGFGSLILPQSVVTRWEDVPTLELTTIGATLNPTLDDALFTLAK